uniref:Uncharacterized protein n=1 Tax=Arundo donax TaxID=35708 RepID=A0A0A9BZZ5_ARUDO
MELLGLTRPVGRLFTRSFDFDLKPRQSYAHAYFGHMRINTISSI